MDARTRKLYDAKMRKAGSCSLKKRFVTRGRALEAMGRLCRDTGEPVSAFTVYRCDHCGLYHVGHRRR
jgi:hypothetical protein